MSLRAYFCTVAILCLCPSWPCICMCPSWPCICAKPDQGGNGGWRQWKHSLILIDITSYLLQCMSNALSGVLGGEHCLGVRRPPPPPHAIVNHGYQSWEKETTLADGLTLTVLAFPGLLVYPRIFCNACSPGNNTNLTQPTGRLHTGIGGNTNNVARENRLIHLPESRTTMYMHM